MEEIRSGSRGRSRSPRGRSPPRGRSRSPPRRSRSPPRGRSPPRDRSRSRSRGRSPPRRSRSPPRDGRDGREPPSPREPRGDGDDGERKPRVPPEEEVGRQVYVGNLNFNTDKKVMEDAVGEYGKIRDIYMPADNDGRPRGFCFVTFEEKTQAEACALGMNGRELDGRVVRCNIARPRPTADERRRRRDDYDRPRGRRPPDGRIFVEGLPDDIKERELDDLFYRYGRIDYIEIRRDRRRLEACICYFDRRDAAYAARETDGMRFERDKLRVDLER